MMSISWLPIFIVKFLNSYLFPGEIDKIDKANTDRMKNEEQLMNNLNEKKRDKSLLI